MLGLHSAAAGILFKMCSEHVLQNMAVIRKFDQLQCQCGRDTGWTLWVKESLVSVLFPVEQSPYRAVIVGGGLDNEQEVKFRVL